MTDPANRPDGQTNGVSWIGAGMGDLDRTIQDNPTLDQHGALADAYDFFNEGLFGGRLPRCMITLDARIRRCYGFFVPHRWECGGGRRTHGISLNPATIKSRTLREVISTLVHEQAHLWQQEFGHPSRRGYHNREWAEMMMDIGLMPSHTGLPGGRRTGDRMTHYVLDGGPFDRACRAMPERLLLPWVAGDPAAASQGKVTGTDRSKSRYSCPGCGINVWGRPGLRIVCGRCDVPLS